MMSTIITIAIVALMIGLEIWGRRINVRQVRASVTRELCTKHFNQCVDTIGKIHQQGVK